MDGLKSYQRIDTVCLFHSFSRFISVGSSLEGQDSRAVPLYNQKYDNLLNLGLLFMPIDVD
jgi:hypothetical protein